MKTCEAFSKIGTEVVLSVPNFILFDYNKDDPFDYYNVERLFKIKKVLSIRLIRLGPVGFFLETFIFSLGLIFTSDFWRADYIFSRDEMLVFIASLFGRKIIWETHTGSYNIFAKIVLSKAQFIVSISQGLKDYYVSKGIPDSKILVCHDGVDLEDFRVSKSKLEARNILRLPQDKKIILYAGRLDGWKGVETFFEASKSFNEDMVAVVVGGDKSQVNSFSKKYPNIFFLGFKLYKELSLYQKSADVLVVPNTAKSEVSRLYTSPLKVFSYMASGVPIVASDLPSVREVLNERNSTLVSPDSPEALLAGIESVIYDSAKAEILAKQAKMDAVRYSWTERAKNIISSI